MAWNTTDRKVFANISATTAAFTLLGGRYGIEVVATFGGGSVKLQRLSNDGSTYVDVSTYSANTYETLDLPNGTYKLTVATASAIYAEIIGVITVAGGA
jgi:microcystin-dependent protein